MMRLARYKLPLLALALGFSMQCTGLDNIDIEAGGETTIEGSVLGDLLGPLSFFGFEGIDISQSQEFRNQGYSKDQIDSARLSVLTLTVTEPESGNFDFLSSISFFVEADGLPQVEIARLDPIPKGASKIEMEILDQELLAYAIADTMTVTTSATGTSPDQDTTVSAALVLNVDVNVDGAIGCRVAASKRVSP